MIFNRNKGGFSLLELTVVLIIITILASAAVPQLIRAYLEKAANKTALDISSIQEAARAFYVNNTKWPDNSTYPTSIAALQASNYLPSSWNAINPFGMNASNTDMYAYKTSSSGSTFTVSTNVPLAAETIIQNLLPINWVSGNTISSSIAVPGTSSSIPTGTIVAWPVSNLPVGFLWCNGQNVSRSTYAGLFAVIGTIYGSGDGLTTFALPDAMGRTIVGVDGMGGTGLANRITQWGSFPSTMGAPFGEDTHHLTVPELPAHNFNILVNDTTTNNGSTRYPETVAVHSLKPYYTNTVGNDERHNVVQPSIAMGYVIKY